MYNPVTNSVSWGCNSSSLIFSMRFAIESTDWSATMILECKSLAAVLVLSMTWVWISFANWCWSWSHFFSYSFRMTSLAYSFDKNQIREALFIIMQYGQEGLRWNEEELIFLCLIMIGKKHGKGNGCIQFIFPLSNQRESNHGYQPYK